MIENLQDLSLSELNNLRKKCAEVIKSQVQKDSRDILHNKASKLLEETNEFVDAVKNGSVIEQISEMDDILFTLLSIYDLRGMSIEEALSRQISKHEYRQSKGYDYLKRSILMNTITN